MQFYIDESREADPTALPDAEVFFVDRRGVSEMFEERIVEEYADAAGCDCINPDHAHTRAALISERVGWYWWACFPGCMPDSDPIGPFDTMDDAIKDARA